VLFLHSLKKVEFADYRDTVVGDIKLRKDGRGNWVSEQGVKISAEKGRIVVTSKVGEENIMIKKFEPAGRLDSCSINNSKAKIDVEVSVNDEKKWMKEFIERIKNGETNALYKDCMMEKMKNVGGIWFFEELGKRRIQIEIDKENNEISVIESNIHKSVERVDTKIFSLNNELLTFDSATNYGATSKINVQREQDETNKFLSIPAVKLRKQAEFQMRAAS
jgi:hypothetical protein